MTIGNHSNFHNGTFKNRTEEWLKTSVTLSHPPTEFRCELCWGEQNALGEGSCEVMDQFSLLDSAAEDPHPIWKELIDKNGLEKVASFEISLTPAGIDWASSSLGRLEGSCDDGSLDVDLYEDSTFQGTGSDRVRSLNVAFVKGSAKPLESMGNEQPKLNDHLVEIFGVTNIPVKSSARINLQGRIFDDIVLI
ncbi:hypothetical protein V865_002246 [Kwoniella europaea PYCC6329]|uniref:NADH:ubiquinone oxidoreductase intermediate-associated protein 30 domain-containing protein n=1 Tax=Kwoniella europaea PYCC6329 TaxID=1423913 RepID=A0AAX4KDP8_9TREE